MFGTKAATINIVLFISFIYCCYYENISLTKKEKKNNGKEWNANHLILILD